MPFHNEIHRDRFVQPAERKSVNDIVCVLASFNQQLVPAGFLFSLKSLNVLCNPLLAVLVTVIVHSVGYNGDTG